MDPMTIAGLAQTALGIGQSIIAGGKARKAQRQLEGMIDSYKPSQSIMDYYTKAMNRYNQNPYTSAAYNMATQQAGRNLATGISSLQDRRSALAGVGTLAQGASDSGLRAAAMAEQQQAQNLAQLGQAVGLKDREDKYKFEAKYNLLAQKAGAANQGVNAGIGNIAGGLGSITDYAMINKMYSGGTGLARATQNPTSFAQLQRYKQPDLSLINSTYGNVFR